MLIRNVVSAQDLKNKKALQAKLLQTQIDNENLRELKQRKYLRQVAGVESAPVPPQYKTTAEIQADTLTQQREAINNLASLGLDFNVASQISQDLLQMDDGEANLLKLNKNFPFIKKDITENYNPKLLDAQTIENYLRRFFDEIDDIIGLKIKDDKSTNLLSYKGTETTSAPEDTIADIKQYGEVRDNLIAIMNLYEVNSEEIFDLVKRIDLIAINSPYKTDLDLISVLTPINRNRIYKTIKKLIEQYHIPTQKLIADEISALENFTNGRIINYDINHIPTHEEFLENETDGEEIEIKKVEDGLILTLRNLKYIISEVSNVGIKNLKDFNNKLDKISANLENDELKLKNYKPFPRPDEKHPVQEDESEDGAEEQKGDEREDEDEDEDESEDENGRRSRSMSTSSSASIVLPKKYNIVTPGPSQISAPRLKLRSKSKSPREIPNIEEGTGLRKKYQRNRVKIGKGIEKIDEEIPTYSPFGKTFILANHLLKTNILSLRNKGLTQGKWKPIEVSDGFRDFILDALECGKCSQTGFNNLTPQEQSYFCAIVDDAGLSKTLKLDNRLIKEQQKRDLDRLDILFGEIQAGNDNVKMNEECHKLLKKYIANGVINKDKGMKMILQI